MSNKENKRRASKVPGRSLSLAPTLSGEQSVSGGRAENRVIINVGGVRYETYKSTLKNIPDTRLSWITESTAHNSDYDADTGEFFFDRHPGMFNMILNYYRTGKLHAPTDVCGPLFEEELAFWGIDEKQIEACCWMTYRTHRDAQETLAELDEDDEEDEDEDTDKIAERFGIHEDESPARSCWNSYQSKLWALLEEPYSSLAAQMLAIISIMFVLLSIAIFALETHVLFRQSNNASHPIDYTWSVQEINTNSKPLPAFDYIDYVCVAYFTLEFLMRLIFCPNTKDFFKNALNWVDLFSILPFFIEKLILLIQPGFNNTPVILFFNYIRLIRIFRIFKLTRHFSGLKILGHTIKASAKEMMLLGLFLLISIIIFACFIYLAESVQEADKNDFKSIPIGLWWACVTMTTLGYGDIYPRTMLGYIVGALCGVAGVLVLALPVPVIVNNFALYYSHAQARLKLPKKRRRILVGAPDLLKTQIGLPGESIAESGRAVSPTVSDRGSTPSLRKTSTDSCASYDSGIKTGESNESDNSGGGISVIFTDETSVSDSPNRLPEVTLEEFKGNSYPESLHVPPQSGSPRDHRIKDKKKDSLNVNSARVDSQQNSTSKEGNKDIMVIQRRTSLRPTFQETPRTKRRRSLMPHMTDVDA